MLSLNQEKLIKSLQTVKGREKSGLCLVEGPDNVLAAKNYLEYTFSESDSKNYTKLLTTQTPQNIAGVARVPKWTHDDLLIKPIIIVLDGVQDPGNVGTIMRLALGYQASIILVESADPSNSKTIRSSVGAIFNVPWLKIEKSEATEYLLSLKRDIYRLENRDGAIELDIEALKKIPEKLILIAGSEGQGINLDCAGQSIVIKHETELESLNVAIAVGIFLSLKYINL